MKVDFKAIAAGAILIILSMATWQFVRLVERVDDLTEAVTKLKIAVEVASGGDPFGGP